MPAGRLRAELDHDVLIVGSGLAGLGMAIRLRLSGHDDFCVLEQSDSVGGTWRQNAYPGCSCDVPSHLYSYSFAPNPGWSRRYSPQAEIRAYAEDCADRFGVRERIRFGARMSSARWDQELGAWRVGVNRDEELIVRHLVAATGALSQPSRPRVAGLDTFPGPVLHSAAWDEGFDTTGLRVGVVGSGASAAQIIPALVGVAAKLAVFQRSPAWVLPRHDRAYAAIERRLLAFVPGAARAYRERDRLILDARHPMFTRPRLAQLAEARAKLHLGHHIDDPALRAALTPAYRIGCKRIILSDDYLDALNRPDVDVIPEAVAEVDGAVVRGAGGSERELDALVLATGFQVGAALLAGPIRGRDGANLLRIWAGEGATAHRGTMVAGFPNLYVLSGPNSGLGHSSALLMSEAQIEHVLGLFAEADARGAEVIEPTAEAQSTYNEQLSRRLGKTVWNSGGCRSWYLDRSGRNTAIWPGTAAEFQRALERPDPAEFSFSALRT